MVMEQLMATLNVKIRNQTLEGKKIKTFFEVTTLKAYGAFPIGA